jgi:hypothetical protein
VTAGEYLFRVPQRCAHPGVHPPDFFCPHTVVAVLVTASATKGEAVTPEGEARRVQFVCYEHARIAERNSTGPVFWGVDTETKRR